MATVYRARHQFLDKDYAIKVLHGQIAADSTMARRFQREAKTLGQIKHPNVVSVDNFGATATGLLYMVMEFVDGPTLAQALKAQGPFAPGRAADIVRQVATGLQAAHRKGFVHRDLKPGNIMIRSDDDEGDVIKLLDFGLVRILTPDTDQTQLTQDGQFFGTPMYMAPEQITGHPVGPFTDLYALGVILYQMLSGKPPFLGDVKKLAYHHVQVAPAKLPSAFGGLSALAHRLLAKDPSERPNDATEVIAFIDELALTPISRPMRRRASGAGTAGLDDTLDDVAQQDDQALSRPVLQEERAFRTAHEADPGLRASIDAALGRRRSRARVLLAVLMLLVGVVGGIYIANGYRFELDALQAKLPVPEPVAPTPALKTLDDTAAVQPPPPSASDWITGAANGVADAGVRRSLDAGGAAAAAVPPSLHRDAGGPAMADETNGDPLDGGAASIPDAFDIASRSFDELDDAIGRALARRGLSFDDVIDADPEAAERWQRWRDLDDAERPISRRVRQVYRRLDGLIHTIVIDDALLQKKLERADSDLRVLKAVNAAVPASEIAQLRRRLDAASADHRRRPRKKSPQALAAEISAIERAIADSDARERPEDPEPSAVTAPPSGTATTATSTTEAN